ncbi:hypothetical protein TanjilG_22273 [Lupinus angustifolius]|uniref:Glycoside hydrolase family 13 N-terminal domain-containing protein n=1 Tax=Lupinus angustifolius TaxID=3871 RepID=A0A1J7GK41_LUPAN|nr:hypothetical protein TanjilG_22273 [Lupinus angustifolius]
MLKEVEERMEHRMVEKMEKHMMEFAGKTLFVKVSSDSNSTSSEYDKVLIPEDQENKYNNDEAARSYVEDEDVHGSVVSSLIEVDTHTQAETTSVSVDKKLKIESDAVKPKIIPPPDTRKKIYEIDPFLQPHCEHFDFRCEHFDFRYAQYKRLHAEIDKYEGGLDAFSRGYKKFGFIHSVTCITDREWALGAKTTTLIEDFNRWNPSIDEMVWNEFCLWEIFLPNNVDGSLEIPHGSRVKIRMTTLNSCLDQVLYTCS